MGKINYKNSNAKNKFLETQSHLSKYWENIAISIFEWKGDFDKCPGLSSTIMERILYEHGESAFFYDGKIGFLNLQSGTAGGLNVYQQPVKAKAIGLGYSKTVEYGKNAVRIKNNALAEPTKPMVEYYIEKLADIELTKDIRRNAHKTPFMLETTQDAQLTAQNVFEQIMSNEPAIYKNKGRGSEALSVNVLNTDVPYMNADLEDDYHNYEGRILTILGLDNFVEDKKERVQSAEVKSNEEYIMSAFRPSLLARQKACEEINLLYGLNFSVDYVWADKLSKDDENKEDDIDE